MSNKRSIGWVYAANSAIVDEIGAVDLVFNRIRPDEDGEEISSHPILNLLDSPHAGHDGDQVRSLLPTYRKLVGDSILLMRSGASPAPVTKGR